VKSPTARPGLRLATFASVAACLAAAALGACRKDNQGGESKPLGAAPGSPPGTSPAPGSSATPGAPPPGSAAQATDGMVHLPAGTFWMGSDNEVTPDATPVHEVALDGFWLDKHEVTNAQFERFVRATSYVTTAEKPPRAEDYPGVPKEKLVTGSVCFHPPEDEEVPLDNPLAWWRYQEGADWRHPLGKSSSLEGREHFPVVHVSWFDAEAFCKWAGKRLPTEAEWEYAARGGHQPRDKRTRFLWGDSPTVGGRHMANVFQGKFPARNTKADGFEGASPVGSFPPNKVGLFDMAGNVWEWVADLYRPDYYAESPRKNPLGPEDGFDPQEPGVPKRVQRGGSFLCSERYCFRYTAGARGKGAPDTGNTHVGFRCARSG
jgi:formylglycine-generating enzyme required for sulfatase activity